MCKLSLPAPILSPFSVLPHFCSPNSNKDPPPSETILTPSGSRAQYQHQVHVAATTVGPTLITQSRKLSSVCWDTCPAAGANLLQPGVPICFRGPAGCSSQALGEKTSRFYLISAPLSIDALCGFSVLFCFSGSSFSSGIETIIIIYDLS